MPPRVAAVVGSVLIILVGLARGFGGVVLLSPNGRVMTETEAGPGQPPLLGAGLLVVAALSVCSGVLVLLKRPSGVSVGLIAMAAFVLGGLINGTLLFGSPRLVGLAGNVVIAAVICTLLVRSRASVSFQSRDRRA